CSRGHLFFRRPFYRISCHPLFQDPSCHPLARDLSCPPLEQGLSCPPLDQALSCHPLDQDPSCRPSDQDPSCHPLDLDLSCHLCCPHLCHHPFLGPLCLRLSFLRLLSSYRLSFYRPSFLVCPAFLVCLVHPLAPYLLHRLLPKFR